MRNVYYNKSDRKVIGVIFLLMLASAVLFYYSGSDGNDPVSRTDTTDSLTGVEGLAVAENHRFHRDSRQQYYVEERQPELFPFDPNTADSTALLRLGLRPWQVRNIYKYRARGGIYRRPGDFARLYGLTVGEFRRLKPYIRISPDYLPASSLPEAALPVRDTLKYPVKITDGERIVLNTADTAMLRRVPGIGSAFARAIVGYGERLGGYVSVEQLDEIDDFPPEAKKYFVVSSPQPKRLNLNRLTVSQMRRHPYISFHQAKAIEDYRRLHGSLRSLQDLHMHRDFTPEAIKRLEPYVEF